MPETNLTLSWQQLRKDFALQHDEGACLPLRSRHGQCRACAQACPANALTVDLSGVRLADSCNGCGICVAACPTEALMLPELQPLLVESQQPASPVNITPLRLECRKVPPQLHQGQTLVLPCLGALRAGQLMSWTAQGVQVEVVDRGWCGDCDVRSARAQSSAHPADAALDLALLWLQEMQAQPLPRRVEEPLALQHRPPGLPPAPLAEEPLSRRDFLRGAAMRPTARAQAKVQPMGGNGRAAYPAEQRRPSPERQRQWLALQRLAHSQQRTVPEAFFARLYVHQDDCCDERLCVALCPTAALTVVEEGAVARLQVLAERCIGCGVCQRACPQGALQVQPHGGQPGTQILATHVQRHCARCGERYTPATDDATKLCPSCAKAQRFIDDARRQLFGVSRAG